MSLCNVRCQMANVARMLVEVRTSHVAASAPPAAISVPRGCQLAPIRLDVSFGPLLHREALRGHDRNPMTQDLARSKLQPFVQGRSVTEANNIGKRVAI